MHSKELPTLLIDTREQKPYSFDLALCRSLHVKLDAADYSVEGMQHLIAVERKSLDDFAATLSNTSRRKRFYAELERLENHPHRCIVVEGSLGDILSGRYRSGAAPASIFGSAVSLMADPGVPVVFCGDRQHACAFTQTYLLHCRHAVLKDMEKAASGKTGNDDNG